MTCKFRSYFLLVILIALTASQALAIDDENLISYEFATWMGTGAYRIAGRRVNILRIPFSMQLREMTEQQMGFKLHLPVTVGTHDFTDLVPLNLESFTFIPGLELQHLLRDNWIIKPYLQAGIGSDFSGGDDAFIYAGGVKSITEFERDPYTWSLGGGFLAAGSRVSGSNSQFSKFDLGVAVHRPINWTVAGRGTRASLFYVASFFGNGADILLPRTSERPADEINQLNTVGVSLGVDRPFSFFGVQGTWIGFSYVSGDGVEGLRFNAGFPF